MPHDLVDEHLRKHQKTLSSDNDPLTEHDLVAVHAIQTAAALGLHRR